MNNWKKATETIKFNGYEEVLTEIEKLSSEESRFSGKIKNFLNYELYIPTKSILAVCTMVALIVSFKVTTLAPETYAYSITVINERGSYEKTY